MELKEGQVYTNSLGDKIEILGVEAKVVCFTINRTTYWCTDFNKCFDIIGR